MRTLSRYYGFLSLTLRVIKQLFLELKRVQTSNIINGCLNTQSAFLKAGEWKTNVKFNALPKAI